MGNAILGSNNLNILILSLKLSLKWSFKLSLKLILLLQITYMSKLNLQLLTLFSQIQKFSHRFILFFSCLLKISSELCDNVVSFFDSSLKFLQLKRGKINAFKRTSKIHQTTYSYEMLKMMFLIFPKVSFMQSFSNKKHFWSHHLLLKWTVKIST